MLLQFLSHKLVSVSTLSSIDATTNTDIICGDNLPIALRKDKRTCTSYLISRLVSYAYLFLFFYAFISYVELIFSSQIWSEALSIPGWMDAMKEEMLALE